MKSLNINEQCILKIKYLFSPAMSHSLVKQLGMLHFNFVH